MSMINQSTDQQTHDNNSTIMITSPDRNHQAECSLVLPSTANTAAPNEENSKSTLKKEESLPVTIEEITISQPETTGSFTIFITVICNKFLCIFFICISFHCSRRGPI